MWNSQAGWWYSESSSATATEEGRIGYVALTRAKSLFRLAVPNSCLSAMRAELIKAGFTEAS